MSRPLTEVERNAAKFRPNKSIVEQILANAQDSRPVVQDFVPLAQSLEWELGQKARRQAREPDVYVLELRTGAGRFALYHEVPRWQGGALGDCAFAPPIHDGFEKSKKDPRKCLQERTLHRYDRGG